MTDTYFALPRATRPADWFGRILPGLPLRLPPISLSHSAVFHITGPVGGTWTQQLLAGRLVVSPGVVGPVATQTTVTAAHFRELLFGAVRDRHVQVLHKLGLPVAIPDVSRVPVDPARVAALANLRGTLAIDLYDRHLDDTYRIAITFGGGPTAHAAPDTVVETDLDDLATLVAARTPPLQLLTSGKLRIRGDADLPVRALTTALGRTA
ncbi:MAG: SCP2 sterol-binding domain-containing protein [Deltaproteobacteria bacterium]|nr:SCP2 sterol-binding domain-containing protein [Deltaproteobacteria bacterium]